MQKRISVLLLGIPGAGKSTLGNVFLSGNPFSKIFQSGESVETGLTKIIQIQSGKLFGQQNGIDIQVIDIPGIGDSNISIEFLVNEFKQKVHENAQVDVAIIVVKSNEYRQTIQQRVTVALLKNFFQNIEPKSLIWVFSHCDTQNPSLEFQENKIKSYDLPVKLPNKNRIFFTINNPSTLFPIEPLLQSTSMKVTNNLSDAGKKVDQSIRESIKLHLDNFKSKIQNLDDEIKNYAFIFNLQYQTNIEMQNKQFQNLEHQLNSTTDLQTMKTYLQQFRKNIDLNQQVSQQDLYAYKEQYQELQNFYEDRQKQIAQRTIDEITIVSEPQKFKDQNQESSYEKWKFCQQGHSLEQKNNQNYMTYKNLVCYLCLQFPSQSNNQNNDCIYRCIKCQFDKCKTCFENKIQFQENHYCYMLHNLKPIDNYNKQVQHLKKIICTICQNTPKSGQIFQYCELCQIVKCMNCFQNNQYFPQQQQLQQQQIQNLKY